MTKKRRRHTSASVQAAKLRSEPRLTNSVCAAKSSCFSNARECAPRRRAAVRPAQEPSVWPEMG
ncbi:MAG: hypothetical protein KDB27_09460, partial [Planctomycetales bacterium]|nr:hypothetical protein [Planctomycetales bacterium]